MRTYSLLSTAEFMAVIEENERGLASAVTVLRRTARGLVYQTRDSHAAHAVQILAERKGLTVTVTRPDDGSYVIGLKGFAKDMLAHRRQDPHCTCNDCIQDHFGS